MNPTPVITRHAIERYQQRVDRSASPRAAAVAISRILDTATSRATPRRWSRAISTAPGTRYLYSAELPGVCLVVAGGAVVTVHSRPVCAAWLRLAEEIPPRRAARPRAAADSRGDWAFEAEAA